MRWFFQRRRYDVDVQESFLARPRRVWEHLLRIQWLDGEVQWVEGTAHILWDGTRIKIRKVEAPHRLSFEWIPPVGDRTTVEASVSLLPNGRTQLRIQHQGFISEQLQRRYQGRWQKVLRGLGQTL